MHHPGPPRFVAVGETVELAPRDPEPAETYAWELVRRPDESSAELGVSPVEEFEPDVAGTYVACLSAPDGTHRHTIRVFPSEQIPASSAGASHSGQSGQRGQSGHSGRMSGRQSGDAGSGSERPETAPDGPGGRPRLRLTPIVEDDQLVVRADPRPHPDGSETTADLDVVFLLDDRDGVERSAATIGDRELTLPLEDAPEQTRVHAVAVGEHGYSVPDAVSFHTGSDDSSQPPTVESTRLYDPPEWAQEAFIYEIYVRSFSPDDRSPFEAILDKLEYIDSLGVDAIWLTPVLQNDHAPHGYNITDFFSIATDLGSRDDYERLVEAAHDRDIAVLFDAVCNHSARTHPHFEDAVGNPDSEYRDWYNWQSETEPETYFEWEHIANFNFENLEVRRHLLDAFEEWLGLVDGFRCDMAWAVPNSFWRELYDRCKTHDTEFLLLDETIPYIPDYQAGLFDVHFDSTTYFTLRQIGHGQDADTVLDAIEARRDSGFPNHAGFMLYTENHDESRYITDCGRPAAKAAMGAVFTLPGAPMVYAGQEFGHRGRRDDLAWEHADSALEDHVRQLARLRQDHPALSGNTTVSETRYEVQAGNPERVTAYETRTDDESAIVVLNFGSETASVSVPAAGETDALSGESVAVEDDHSSPVAVESVVVLPYAIE